MGIYFQKFLLLMPFLVIGVPRGTISLHSREMQVAGYRVKPHVYDGWIVYSVLIAALLWVSVESSCAVWNSTLICYKCGAGYVEHLQGSLFLRLFFQGYSR